MPRSLLPPKGIFVPTHLIYANRLPPSLFQTWVQLRGLAWGDEVTPCLPLHEVAALIGKPPSTLYRHMSQLRYLAALSWRTTGSGSIIVSFSSLPPTASQSDPPPMILTSQNQASSTLEVDSSTPILNSKNQASSTSSGNPSSLMIHSQDRESSPPPVDYSSQILSSQNRELPSPPSLNPHSSSSMLPEMNSNIQESDQSWRNESEGGDGREHEGGKGLPILDSSNLLILNSQNCENNNLQTFEPSPVSMDLDRENLLTSVSDSIVIYQSLAHLKPNDTQSRLIRSKVTNHYLWETTIQHWLWHKWNPGNVSGMLDLYSRNGDLGCRTCHKPRPA